MDKLSPRIGITVEVEHIIITYLDGNGAVAKLDLTEIIADAAKAAVDEHMKKYHGHQL